MRIAFFTNAYKPTISGVVTSISLFRKGLLETGNELSIIAPEYAGYKDSEPYIFRFPSLDFFHQVDMSLAIPYRRPLEPTVYGIKPDVIHSHHPFIMGNMASSFAKELNIPLIFTFHTLYEEYAQKYVPIAPELAGLVIDEVVERHLMHCNHIIAPTAAIRDLIQNKYLVTAPISIVPTPVDLSRYNDLQPHHIRQMLGLEEAEILLYVGRLSEEKNLMFLIKAFALICAQRPNAYLMMIGKGVDEQILRHLVKKMGLEERVLFTGPVAHEEIPHYAAAADLFLFTSKTDTQGVVLVEAMAAGTPVVAIDASSSRDILSQGGGLLVPEDKTLFASEVIKLLDNQERIESLGREAWQVAQSYNIQAATERLIDVYERAVAAIPSFSMKRTG
jgi:1,2-diacylglycerol 3-alpha-glucosyltransferase